MADRGVTRRDALRITAVAGVSAALGGSALAALIREARLHRVSETRTRMGTIVTITLVHPDGEEGRAMVAAAFLEMERLERILSRHTTQSAVGTLNRTGRVVRPAPELREVLRGAQRYAGLTSGAFDITVAPLLWLYEGAAARRGPMPGRSQVADALALVDHEALTVSPEAVFFERPGMAVTLDGIAKGYIVDRTVEVLTRLGADRVLVDAGGDMATAGSGSASEPWTIAIQDPHSVSSAAGLVRLSGDCIATSGDYMRTFTEDRRNHHILDPRTGESPAHTSSATVMASTAMDADALSTAVLVLGPDRGVALLESLDGVDGMLVAKDGKRTRTSDFAERMG